MTAIMDIKLFAGCLLTSEVKMHLSKSTSWQNARLDPNPLVEAPYQGKDYLGRYLDQERHTLQDLKILQHEINSTIAHCCPELAGREFELKLFPHTLIA